MTKSENGFTLIVECINDEGYRGSIFAGRRYRATIGQFSVLGVIDEEGESYIYPHKLFKIIEE